MHPLKYVYILHADKRVEYKNINLYDIEIILQHTNIKHTVLLGCSPDLRLGLYYIDITKQEAKSDNISYNSNATEITYTLHNYNGKLSRLDIYGTAIIHHLDRDITNSDYEMLQSKKDTVLDKWNKIEQ